MRKLLVLLGLLLSSPALAQNITCSDRPPSDQSNACANTRFVHNAISGSGVLSLGGATGVLTLGTGLSMVGQQLSLNTAPVGIPTSSYVSGSSRTTTGTINAASTSLTILSALDFVNGQGILVNHAGAAFAVAQVTALTGTPHTVGATSYTYDVSTCDEHGGVGKSVSVTVPNGPSALTAVDRIELSWNSPATCFVIWKNGNFYGTTSKGDASTAPLFTDSGQGPDAQPFWIPSSPPGAALADWLVTTIASGAGTTTLTLSTPAVTSVTGGAVLHDDTVGMNAWIAAINASCTQATISASTTIRTSSPLNPITCAVSITGEAGSNFLPAGAANLLNEYSIINISGTGLGANQGSVYCAEGDSFPTLNASFDNASYIFMSSAAPGNATYAHVSRLTQRNSVTHLDTPCGVYFFDNVDIFNIGGTATGGDTLTVAFDGSFTGHPVTVVSPVSGGQTPAQMAYALAVAINNNATLANSVAPTAWPVCMAWVAVPGTSTDVRIGCQRGQVSSLVGGVTGAGTETITHGTIGTYTSTYILTALDRVSITGISGDGTNIAGRESPSPGYWLISANNLVNSTIANIYGSNFHAGGVITYERGYNNTLDNVRAFRSGNGGHDPVEYHTQTKFTLSNIRATASGGFGIGCFSSSFVSAYNIMVDDNVTGRGYKTSACVNGNNVNISANNVVATGIALSGGTWRYRFTNWNAIGSQFGVNGNNVGVWFSDEFNRYSTFMNGAAVANANDIAIFQSDTNNTFWATQVGAGGISNTCGSSCAFHN